MNDWTLLASILIYGLLNSCMVTAWIGYQDNVSAALRYQRVQHSWAVRWRWVWTMLVLILALIGYFAVVMGLSGATMQPTVLTKGVDWPDPDEMKTVSDEWNNPTQLEIYQDKNLYHIRFMRRCDSCLTIDPGQIHYRYRSRDKTYVSDTADFHPRGSATLTITDTVYGPDHRGPVSLLREGSITDTTK